MRKDRWVCVCVIEREEFFLGINIFLIIIKNVFEEINPAHKRNHSGMGGALAPLGSFSQTKNNSSISTG